jgi:hypothetical protein
MRNFKFFILVLLFCQLSVPVALCAKKCGPKVKKVTKALSAESRTDIKNLPKFRVPRELLEVSKAAYPDSPPTLALGLKAMKERFEKAAHDRLGDEGAKELISILGAMRFIDYVHLAPKLVDIFHKAKPGALLKSKLYSLYDEGPYKTVFKYADEARVYLKGTELPPGTRRLCEVQKITMQNGVEDVTHRELGVVRSVEVWGLQDDPFTSAQIKTIEKNPYLSFVPTKQKGKLVYGQIHYPTIYNVKSVPLDRIRGSHPGLCAKIEAIQKSGSKPDTLEAAKLTQQLITALADERYEFFNRESATLIARLPDIEALHEYIELVAKHFRDIISIHPLVNGNGRSVRFESLYDPLDKIGIPRPRLNNPDRDILAAPYKWVEEVERGIWNNYFLYKDMTMRLELGLPLEHSPELLSPQLSYAVGIHAKNASKKVTDDHLELVPVDPGQFSAFLKIKFQMDPSLVVTMKKDPLTTQSELKEEFKKFVRARRYRYKNSKDSDPEYVAIHLIDPDFYSSFGQVWAHDPIRWRAKMDRWFRTDSLVWRGLPYGDRALGDQEILSMFRRLSDHSIAVNLTGSFPPSPVSNSDFSKARKAVLSEFDRFNQAVFDGKLASVIQDHISEGAMYDVSYGYSNSWNWGTAQKYAWKTEPDVTQGEKDWSLNEGTKVIVGAYPAQHDVDLSRLKVVAPDFSYRAKKEGGRVVSVNRQKEVLGIGAADPDSIMIVQTLNDSGSVVFTYARNPNNPSEIWKIKGRYKPEEGPPQPNKIIERFN